jgi:hypothetical protein
LYRYKKEIILQAVLESVVPWDPTWKIHDGGLHFNDLSDAQMKTVHGGAVQVDSP